MCDTYAPRVGDRVRFYSWAAEMDLFGEVLSVAPQARLATVREDDEDGSTYVKSWDTLHLEAPAEGLVTRLRDERDEAQASARAWESFAKTQAGLLRVSKLRNEDLTERGCWWEAAKSFARDYHAATETAQRHYERVHGLEETVENLRQRGDRYKIRAARAEKSADEELARADQEALRADNAEYLLRIFEEERDKAQRELAELKKALATLSGVEIVPNTLP